MAELNLKQITDKLNAEFIGEVRKLVFWYDANAEFVDDIDSMELPNARVYHLEKDNQFHTKYFLERVDTTTNYLVYAPFPKPALCDNHLADTIRYSKEFFADRVSLIAVDLGIKEKYKPILQKYIKFFGSKERTQKFYDLEIENFNKRVIETALLSVLCKTKVVSFEEIVRTVIGEKNRIQNPYLSEFEKYDLLKPFWEMCEETFGYADVNPSISKFVFTLFCTYSAKTVTSELPQSLKNYCSYKSGNIIAFVDSIMNSVIYSEVFDELSALTYQTLKMQEVLSKIEESDFVSLEIFRDVDKFIIRHLIERLENEDTEAKLGRMSIPEICKMRRKMHYGSLYTSHYYIIENAYHIIKAAHFEPKKTAKNIWNDYVSEDYKVDQRYRYFYYHFDKITDNAMYDTLRDLVENIYTNEYLDKLSVAWSNAFVECSSDTGLPKQQDFFARFVRPAKERTVVIISDAMRFEVAQTLFNKLLEDEKCTANLTPMQSVLPSYTRFGMSALLPHKSLSMSDDYEVLVDGKTCYDLKSREQQIRAYSPNSKAVQFDDIKGMKINELKEVFTGQDVVYVYHDEIDIHGDKLRTEDETFAVCETAVEEIFMMIKRLTSANNIHFIVTADHGFIYKRSRLSESDKITGLPQDKALIGRRYVVSENAVVADGIGTVSLGDILKNSDNRLVCTPIGSDIFKMSGGGQNFVHGGSSLQEMVIPVLDIRTNKNFTETKPVSIALVSLLQKITNLTTNLDFIQSDVVTSTQKETTYKVFFISDDNEKISNDNIYVADKKDLDASKRVFRLKFTFKNKKYDNSKKYYLVAYDEKNNLEVLRHEVKIDLSFVDDFGFDF